MTREDRHKEIVKFLNSLEDTDGKPAFQLKKYNKLRDRATLEKTMDSEEVGKMTRVICEVFAIMSGSAGDINFYDLFHGYLSDKSKREQINRII